MQGALCKFSFGDAEDVFHSLQTVGAKIVSFNCITSIYCTEIIIFSQLVILGQLYYGALPSYKSNSLDLTS